MPLDQQPKSQEDQGSHERGLADLVPQLGQEIAREQHEQKMNEFAKKASLAVGGIQLAGNLNENVASGSIQAIGAIQQHEGEAAVQSAKENVAEALIQNAAKNEASTATQNVQQQVERKGQEDMIDDRQRQQDAEQRRRARAAGAAGSVADAAKKAVSPSNIALDAGLGSVPGVNAVWGAKRAYDAFKNFLS